MRTNEEIIQAAIKRMRQTGANASNDGETEIPAGVGKTQTPESRRDPKSVGVFQDENSPSEPSKDSILQARQQLRRDGGVPSIADVEEVLGETIKKERELALVTFLGMMVTYTSDAQINILFSSPSSSGKTYLPIEIARLFPKEDVIKQGYTSPTSFFHDASRPMKEKGHFLVDMSRKIYLFLDQPHYQLLEKLRPLLSHDDREIIVRITDKQMKYGLRTKHIHILGFPTVMFCSTVLTMDEQEATRVLLLSPSSSMEKSVAAVKERLSRESDRRGYEQRLRESKKRIAIEKYIRLIKDSYVSDIIVKDTSLVYKLFTESIHGTLQGRHARDVSRVMSILKASALFNLPFRATDAFYNGESDQILAQEEDIRIAFDLWNVFAEAQTLGLPPFVFEVYKRVVLPLCGQFREGVKRKQILSKYHSEFHRFLPEHQLRREILPLLSDAGLISEEKNPKNMSELLIYAAWYPTPPSQLFVGVENQPSGPSEQSKTEVTNPDGKKLSAEISSVEDFEIPPEVEAL